MTWRNLASCVVGMPAILMILFGEVLFVIGGLVLLPAYLLYYSNLDKGKEEWAKAFVQLTS